MIKPLYVIDYNSLYDFLFDIKEKKISLPKHLEE